MNGTLTPGSHLQKQKKVSRVNQMKQQTLDTLYQELEAEMQSILGDMQVNEVGELPGQTRRFDQSLSFVEETEDSAVSTAPTESQEVRMSAYDKEVEEMLLNEEEQAKKKELWEAANGDWLRQQEEKRKEREQNGTRVTKRKKKQTVRILMGIEGRIVHSINIL